MIEDDGGLDVRSRTAATYQSRSSAERRMTSVEHTMGTAKGSLLWPLVFGGAGGLVGEGRFGGFDGLLGCLGGGEFG